MAVFLGLALAAPASAIADDRYASPAGGGNPAVCSQASPCNIQDAVEDPSAADGDRVLLLAGLVGYNLSADQLVIDDDITIEPAPGVPRQTLSSVYGGFGGAIDVTSSAHGAVLRSIVINHGGSDTSSGLNLVTGTAERIRVSSNGVFACAVGKGTLRDSVCLMPSPSPDGVGAAGVSVGGAVNYASDLRNVTAISKVPAAAALVLNAAAPNTDLALNGLNVIADSAGLDVIVNTNDMTSSTVVTLANSSFATQFAAGPGSESITPNNVSSNQSEPPTYVNFAVNDFRQAPGSPTIDAGAIDPLIGALDIDGNPRVVQGKAGCPNALPDIGAYEAPAVAALDCTPATPAATPRTKCKKKKRKRSTAATAKKKRCKKRKKGR